MEKFKDWTTDIEAQDIATKLQAKYGVIFGEYEFSKICFLRMMTKKSKEAAKIISTGFPFDVKDNFVYYVLIFDKCWQILSDEQRYLTIFDMLLSMSSEGFDPESNNYAKISQKDVKEFSELLAATNMLYNWSEPGVKVPNILVEEKKEDV